MKFIKTLAAMGLTLGTAAGAQAANINVGDGVGVTYITTSTIWTANNVYNLKEQVYVTNGATLTIEPGTVLKSDQGSLAVCRGSKIFVQGTQDAPVVMTSIHDNGAWREAALEWGNLTVMGRAYVGNSVYSGNSASPTPTNIAKMEGLTDQTTNDPNNRFGGGDDDDDSGTITYLSIRYGGKVLGVGDELNGLSMGGVGRGTDVHHLEIMNNVDDGVETWGGTVNYKYVTIWNIGDDSFDVDMGWRGKAQFLFIVQGHSLNASQGSGVGDNAFEFDGAENADAQPVTTACIYNATLIGQPIDGDHATAWRDSARVQFRNCVFMDLGDKLVAPDWSDFEGPRNGTNGNGVGGYGAGGTTTFANIWTTPWSTYSAVNAPADPAAFYTAQSAGLASIGQGYLAEITDSVFFRNLNNAYSVTAANAMIPDSEELGADQVGITVSGGSNAAKGNVVAAFNAGSPDDNMPIKALTRAASTVVKGGKTMWPVVSVDPRAANDALASNYTAPADGFFTPAPYRGAFSKDVNWARGWTAADSYGFYAGSANASDPNSTSQFKAISSTVSFATVNGVVYSVESSSDMVNWTPITTIVGDGGTKSVSDFTVVDDSKFYRALAQ